MRLVIVAGLVVLTAGPGSALADGKEVYDSRCSVCHAAGVAGAPKFQSEEDWAPRIAKGKDTLHESAIGGLNAMPPKGGAMDLSDDDVKSAVDYMVEQAGGYPE